MEQQQQALEQSQQLRDQANNGSGKSSGDNKISRSEMNKYNREKIKEARRRMAEKYGDIYDENENDNDFDEE